LYINIKGLEKREDDKDEFHGFYNADGLLLSLNGAYFGLFDKIKMFKYFGFVQLVTFFRWIEDFLKKFTK